MIFELDLYEWPSFMFARRNTGHFSQWDGELMQICDFRVVASAHAWIDIGRAAIDRDASESQVTTSPLTVEANGDWEYRATIDGKFDCLCCSAFDTAEEGYDEDSDSAWWLLFHGELFHVSQPEVTL